MPPESVPESHTPGALQAAQEAQAAFLQTQATPEAAPADLQPAAVTVPVISEKPAGSGFDLAGAQREAVLPTNAATEQLFAQDPNTAPEVTPLAPPVPSPEATAVSPMEAVQPAATTEAPNLANVLDAGDKLVIPPQIENQKVEAVKRQAGETIASPADLRGLGQELLNLPENLTRDGAARLIGLLALAQRDLEDQASMLTSQERSQAA